MATVIEAILALLLVAAAVTATYHRRKAATHQRHTQELDRRLREHAARERDLTQWLRQISDTVLPQAFAENTTPAPGTPAPDAPLPRQAPSALVATEAAHVVTTLVDRTLTLLRETRHAAEGEAARREEDTLRAAREATVDAVRSFSAKSVSLATTLSEEVSRGLRKHQDDASYETLNAIDHTTQMLLHEGQGILTLSGAPLSRRSPATTLTDIIGAAQGRIRDYGRVTTPELDRAVSAVAAEAVIHTVVVLLDNATRYSPPESRVEVRFQQGYAGVTIEIDDAGVQMNPEQLAKARAVLSAPAAVADIHQLGAHPRFGFHVAAQLARRYGFSVGVMAPNRFRGTTATLFVPNELLTAAPAPGRPTAGPATPVTPVRAADPADTTGEATDPSTGRTASGLTVRRRAAKPASGAAPRAETPPGSAGIAGAWMDGARAARRTTPSPGSQE